MNDRDIKYLIGRLERVIELLNIGERHMAIAKLLADISALKLMGVKQKKSAKRARST